LLQDLFDVRTVLVGYALADTLCLVVMGALYRQYRKRSPEIGLWLADYALQFVGLLLVSLRGVIPDVYSVILANVFILGGTVLLYQGLERYLGRRGPQLQNYLLVVVFTAVQSYYLLVDNSLVARNVNISVCLGLLTAECAWLTLYRVGPELRSATRATGLIFVALVVLSVTHALTGLCGLCESDFLRSGVDGAVLLGYEMLYVALTFALLLLVSRRLYTELESDMAQRRAVEDALKRSEEKFSVAFHTVPDAILITLLADGRIIEANRSSFEIFGFTKDEMVGRTTVALGMWAQPADRERFVGELESSGRVLGFNTTSRRKSGEVFPTTVSGETIEISGVPCSLTVVHDSTERLLAEERLRELSERDPLTSILNHRTFHEIATQRLSAARDRRAAVLFMDMDGLKAINDEYGHSAGDQALVAFAGVLREAFRESDVIGRLGGDEFAVLAVPRGDASDETLTSRLYGLLAEKNASKALPFELAVSIGIVWTEPSAGSADLERLISEADRRMYQAKRSRR